MAVGGGIGRVGPLGVVRKITGVSGTSSLILDEEKELVITGGVVITSALSRLCRRYDALLSLNRVRIEEEHLRLAALCLASARLSSQICRVCEPFHVVVRF